VCICRWLVGKSCPFRRRRSVSEATHLRLVFVLKILVTISCLVQEFFNI